MKSLSRILPSPWERGNGGEESIMKKQKPKNLTECIQMLDKNLKKQDKEYIKALTEEEFFMESHFTLGMGIRNEWFRSGNPELVKFFLDQGVKHLDDMSAMILTSYYRHLTNSNN